MNKIFKSGLVSMMLAGYVAAVDVPPTPSDTTIPTPTSSAAASSAASGNLATTLKSKGAYNIDVVFYQTGSGAWDWTACLSGAGCYKLLGAESASSFKYDMSGTAKPTNPLSTGYFIAYETNGGADGLKWVFASKDAQFAAKLAGATTDLKNMNWDTTATTGVSYTVSSDEKTITFK